ncbi:MAG: hypothetical protein HC883_00645 [Bdellovibrionaceae bacterium]|nr:hypothetical protein [Pseudobdellovibrionaceae bacterium]
MEVTRINTLFGSIVLKRHPRWNQLTGGTTGGAAYKSAADQLVILDMENLKYRYLRGRDTKYEKTLEANGMDGMKSGWITECGAEVHQPKTHFRITGLTAAAIDS